MSKVTISKFEHQILKVGDQGFTEKGREALEVFLGNNDEKKFPYYSLIHHGVKFKQYVGVLCVGNLTIEILPKTDKVIGSQEDVNTWRDNLIYMLSKVYKLDVKTPTDTDQNLKPRSSILDVFIKKFLDEVDMLMNRGLVKCYHKEEGNRSVLKGKLLIDKHLMKNYIHKERFYVRFTTYYQEHVLNRILRKALTIIPKVTSNMALRGHATSTLFTFPEVNDIIPTPELFASIEYNRKTDDYRQAIQLAGMFLLHYMPDLKVGKQPVMALMFDMNKLWEEFMFRLLRGYIEGSEVRAQERMDFWSLENNKNTKTIRPDIVLTDKKGTQYVIDTKWKVPDGSPADADLHQMFAYKEFFKAEKVALLYPSTDNKMSSCRGYFKVDGDQKNCDMIFFPIIKEKFSNNIKLFVDSWIKK